MAKMFARKDAVCINFYKGDAWNELSHITLSTFNSTDEAGKPTTLTVDHHPPAAEGAHSTNAPIGLFASSSDKRIGGEPTFRVMLYGLNVDKINEAYGIMKAAGLKWGAIVGAPKVNASNGTIETNSAGLVLSLLYVGGLSSLFGLSIELSTLKAFLQALIDAIPAIQLTQAAAEKAKGFLKSILDKQSVAAAATELKLEQTAINTIDEQVKAAIRSTFGLISTFSGNINIAITTQYVMSLVLLAHQVQSALEQQNEIGYEGDAVQLNVNQKLPRVAPVGDVQPASIWACTIS